MTKTKTDYFGALIIIIATICSTGLFLWMTYEWITSQENVGLLQKLFFTTISALVTPLLWIIEIPKLKSVKIDDEKLTFKNLLTGTKREIRLLEFDGFKTTSQWARGGPVYEITLFIKGRRFHEISSNYIKNYDEIRIVLNKRLDNLGTEKFNYLKYIKEHLTNKKKPAHNNGYKI